MFHRLSQDGVCCCSVCFRKQLYQGEFSEERILFSSGYVYINSHGLGIWIFIKGVKVDMCKKGLSWHIYWGEDESHGEKPSVCHSLSQHSPGSHPLGGGASPPRSRSYTSQAICFQGTFTRTKIGGDSPTLATPI